MKVVLNPFLIKSGSKIKNVALACKLVDKYENSFITYIIFRLDIAYMLIKLIIFRVLI